MGTVGGSAMGVRPSSLLPRVTIAPGGVESIASVPWPLLPSSLTALSKAFFTSAP